MLRSKQNSAKLKGKGSETRNLLPFSLHIAKAMYFKVGTEFWLEVVSAGDALLHCQNVQGTESFEVQNFQETGMSFLNHYLRAKELQPNEGHGFGVNPKHHLFQELLKRVVPLHGPPCDYWNYQDESLGGAFSKMALRRGGRYDCGKVAQELLARVAALGFTKH
eukprot:6459514-Amphidinium_carterae.1